MPTPLPVEDCAEAIPYYLPIGDECELFELAYRRRLPLLLKGPTGCGRLLCRAHGGETEATARLIPCHDDLTAADSTGRYLLRGGDTVSVDGPLTRAVRDGDIWLSRRSCEWRERTSRSFCDPLTDHRRILPLDRTGEDIGRARRIHARCSYNPGYQNVLKSLKPEHKAAVCGDGVRFSAPLAAEVQMIAAETGLPRERCLPLVTLAGRLRELKGGDIEEGCSTRLLVYCGALIVAGMRLEDAVTAAIIEPLTDDPEVKKGLIEIARVTLG